MEYNRVVEKCYVLAMRKLRCLGVVVGLLFVLALFAIYTDVNFFLFFKFLIMRIKQWRSKSNVKCRVKYNHVVE